MANPTPVKGWSFGAWMRWAIRERQLDWDSEYGAQCVDLVRYFCHNQGWPQLPPLSHGAKTAFALADAKVWQKIRNTPSGVPRPMDIVVFDGRQSNDYLGHIAVVREGSSTSRIFTIDQNFSKRLRTSYEEHRYTAEKVIGWLRKR